MQEKAKKIWGSVVSCIEFVFIIGARFQFLSSFSLVAHSSTTSFSAEAVLRAPQLF